MPQVETAIGIREKFLNALNAQRLESNKYRGQSLYEIKSGVKTFYVYIKVSTTKEGFWGLTKNLIDKLNIEGKKYKVVLLKGDENTAYILSSNEIKLLVPKLPLSRDGYYKLTETNPLLTSTIITSFEEIKSSLLS